MDNKINSLLPMKRNDSIINIEGKDFDFFKK